ncbi:MAG: hypothetical protein LCH57_14215 [Proteobacteria bacterium]|nr:hypothetical protein [Pseudomonadota bacterium]
MSHLTPLESAVMDALVWQMGDRVPDLAAQVAASSPGLRRNTGAGLYSQMVVDGNRSAANPDATGLFGTVHAMVGGLAQPIGFQVELRQGRLIALHGWSYGQDTRAIDFANTAFDEIFIVDDTGRSILYRPARPAPGPVSPRPRAAVPATPAPTAAPKPVSKSASKPAETPPPVVVRPTPSGADILAGLSDPTASRGGRLALVYLGAYVLAAVAVLFAVAVFRFSWVFALIAAGWMLRSIHGKKGRVQMAALADQLYRQGVFQALKSR